MYNPKVDELFAPTLGPDCPFKSGQQKAHRNTLAGYVEPAHLSEFQFEAQRKTFVSFGKIEIFIISGWLKKTCVKILIYFFQVMLWTPLLACLPMKETPT